MWAIVSNMEEEDEHAQYNPLWPHYVSTRIIEVVSQKKLTEEASDELSYNYLAMSQDYYEE